LLAVIALSLLVDYVQVGVLPINVTEDFEAMSPAWRVGQPLLADY